MLLAICGLFSASFASLEIDILVETDQNASLYQGIDANGSVTNYQQVNSGGSVDSFHEISSEGDVNIWIDGANWTDVPSYVAESDSRWSKDSRGISDWDVAEIMENCYEYRFEGKQTSEEVKKFCYYLEAYIAGLWTNHMKPETQQMDEIVRTETNEDIGTLSETLGGNITELKEKSEENSFKTEYTYAAAYRWSESQGKDVDGMFGELREESNQRRASIEELKDGMKRLNETSKDDELSGAVGLVSGSDSILFGSISAIFLLLVYIAYVRLERTPATKKKVRKHITNFTSTARSYLW